MEQLIVKIDISTPHGRKLARELYGQKDVEIENPIPEEMVGKKMYTIEEAYDEAISILKELYEKE